LTGFYYIVELDSFLTENDFKLLIL